MQKSQPWTPQPLAGRLLSSLSNHGGIDFGSLADNGFTVSYIFCRASLGSGRGKFS